MLINFNFNRNASDQHNLFKDSDYLNISENGIPPKSKDSGILPKFT